MSLERYHRSELIQCSSLAFLFLNPASGGGRAGESLAEVEKLLTPFLRLQVRKLGEAQSLETLIGEALDHKPDLIIAAGGDGTVAGVAEHLIGTDIPLGILPMGTANALACGLYGTKVMGESLTTSCQRILAMQTLLIDTAEANGRTLLHLLGIGFERAMMEGADGKYKEQWGALGYWLSGYEAMQELTPIRFQIEIDGHQERFESTSLVVANSAPFFCVFAQGGGTPQATDGFLDVTWIKTGIGPGHHIKTMLDLLYAGVTDTKASAYAMHRKGKRIRVEADPQVDVTIDGEIALKTPLEIAIRPASLKVIAEPAEEDTH